jgi:hypothetical protein
MGTLDAQVEANLEPFRTAVEQIISIPGASCKTSGIERAGSVAGASWEALMLHFVALQRQIGGCRRTSP